MSTHTFGLTDKAQELLDFLKHYHGACRVMPSFNEMRTALELKSRSSIHRLLGQLEERGHIRRLPGRARAIALLECAAPCIVSLPPDVHARLSASARAFGRSPDDHAAAVLWHYCFDLTPGHPTSVETRRLSPV